MSLYHDEATGETYVGTPRATVKRESIFNVCYASYGRRVETGKPVFHVLKIGRLTFTFALANTYKALS